MQKCPGSDCPEYIEKSIDCNLFEDPPLIQKLTGSTLNHLKGGDDLNHMKCKTCGAEFCYKCGGPYPGKHK